MKENKQKICDLLAETLRATRNQWDIVAIIYDEKTETATVRWASGGKRCVNVAMDSGTAMIRDIMRAID